MGGSLLIVNETLRRGGNETLIAAWALMLMSVLLFVVARSLRDYLSRQQPQPPLPPPERVKPVVPPWIYGDERKAR